MITDRGNQSFDSEISQSHLKVSKPERRAESVALRSTRSNLNRIGNSLSSSKKKLSSSKKSIRSKKSICMSRDEKQHFRNNLSHNKPLDTSKGMKSQKGYLRPTDSSVKKSKNTLNRHTNFKKNLNKDPELKLFSHNPNALLLLFRNMKFYHSQVMNSSPHNRTMKMIYFVFSPYIISMVIIMKHFMDIVKNNQSLIKKNSKVNLTKSKPTKETKADNMLLQLKNQELQEEKAKNSELKRHIEILKKRVYAKMEFEGQTKIMKEAGEMIEQLKVRFIKVYYLVPNTNNYW